MSPKVRYSTSSKNIFDEAEPILDNANQRLEGI